MGFLEIRHVRDRAGDQAPFSMGGGAADEMAPGAVGMLHADPAFDPGLDTLQVLAQIGAQGRDVIRMDAAEPLLGVQGNVVSDAQELLPAGRKAGHTRAQVPIPQSISSATGR